MKKCRKCGVPKPLEDFYNCNRTKDGKRSVCKECTNTENKERNKINKVKYNAHGREYYQNHKAERHAYHKDWYKLNKEAKREQNERWKKENPEKYREMMQNWYVNNRDKKLRQNRENEIKRLQNDPMCRIVKNLRGRISGLVSGRLKSAPTLILLGCSLEFFKEYLASQFRDGMSWENYGVYWHIDHIKPCSLFDLSKQEEQNVCFHYTNMQPLLAKENLAKHNKFNS
jgi:hypothetical protein